MMSRSKRSFAAATSALALVLSTVLPVSPLSAAPIGPTPLSGLTRSSDVVEVRAGVRRGGAMVGPRGGAVVHRGGAVVGPRGGAYRGRTAVVGPRGNVAVRGTTVVRGRGAWARPG